MKYTHRTYLTHPPALRDFDQVNSRMIFLLLKTCVIYT